MGDTYGNLEEQLGSVAGQIRGVGEQILRVEEQIEIVEGQIEKCPDYEERMQLRDEEAQLQDEEAQLRDEKAQLRDEEAQLRDEELLLLQWRGTEREWLLQKIVVPAFHLKASIYPSSMNQERMWIPVKVEHWDVRDCVEKFLNSTDKKKRAYEIDAQLVTMGRGGNDGIGFSEGATASGMVNIYLKNPRADLIVTLREKNVVVVEVKAGGLGSDGDDPWYLHRAWAECSCISGEGDFICRCNGFGITPAHREKVMRRINKLYEYMVLSKVRYGILTDARNWYLFKRDNVGHLKISAGFKASDEPPRVLAALSYLVHRASVDNSEFGDPTGNGEFPVVQKGVPSKPLSNGDYPARGGNNGVFEIQRSGRTLVLQDVSVEDLNLKKAGGVISCEGWAGCVVIGYLGGHCVALKFAYLGTERAEALYKEVVAYMMMEKLWGFFVPRLIQYGTTNKGRVVFVATELIEGVELYKVAVKREVVTAALQALDAVHACGLLHGDVSLSNIMVVKGKEPSVRILDFGFSRVTSRKRLHNSQRVWLERLLADTVK